ncbi:MAG: cytochrome c1, partial [Aestuariivirgaceae bacterium]
AFLAWAGEPKMEERKRIGFQVMIFLAVFAVLLYLVKRRIWGRHEH